MPQAETVILVAKAFQACCELPLLNFLKPVATLCILICETVQTATDNKDAAKELGDRSAEVFILIVDNLRQTLPAEITSDLKDDAVKLQETLKKVNRHLNKLKGGWKRKFTWLWAKKDQDTVRKLSEQLNGALSLFGISRTLAVGREVSRVHDSVLQTREDMKLVLDAIQHTPSTAPEPNDKFDVLCFCGLKVKLYMARTEKNYGRKFLRCPKPVSDSDNNNSQCKFFRWI